MKKRFILSMINILVLCIVIFAVSIFFIDGSRWVGLVLIGLSLLCIVSLLPFNISPKSIEPDIMFGVIDNGILAIFAIFGAHFAGVTGAILGGVVGNAITDGIAGIFEGHHAERLRLKSIPEERTMLKSAVGKMAGCLLGAGIVLLIANFIGF
ncbi:MAG: hypothetical protein WC010_00540 [Candidatus Absconditabacterales bacterium]